ncbi:MAG: hypothetical protein WC612_03780 [Bdellovibrionales bacterium]|jgi:hypothetical protein
MIYTHPHTQSKTMGIPMSRKPRLTPEEIAKAVVHNLGKDRELGPMPVLSPDPTPVERIIYNVSVIKHNYGRVPERSQAVEKTLSFMRARLDQN